MTVALDHLHDLDSHHFSPQHDVDHVGWLATEEVLRLGCLLTPDR